MACNAMQVAEFDGSCCLSIMEYKKKCLSFVQGVEEEYKFNMERGILMSRYSMETYQAM